MITSDKFTELLGSFLRTTSAAKEHMLAGHSWTSAEERRHYFRIRDLERFLEAAGFKTYARIQVAARLYGMSGGRDILSIGGKLVNVCWVPSA